MEMTLYHYLHCPFCVRVRLAAGFLGQRYTSRVLAYDDETTPLKLTGKKMLPIALIDGEAMNESLDIIQKIDTRDSLKIPSALRSDDYIKLSTFIDQISKPLHSLVMPYWIFTPEFSPSARKYFQSKKEEKRGPFKKLVSQRLILEQEIHEHLKKLREFSFLNLKSDDVHFYDILLASHLWGLYVVPEFQFSPELHAYLQKIKRTCSFDYFEGLGDFL